MRGSVAVIPLCLLVAASSAAESSSTKMGGMSFIKSHDPKGPSLEQQIRDAVPEIGDIPILINKIGQNAPGHKGANYDERVGSKRFSKKSAPVVEVAKSVMEALNSNAMVQTSAMIAAALFIMYLFFFGLHTRRAAAIERKREARKDRVKEIRARRTGEQPEGKQEGDAAEKPEPRKPKQQVKSEPKPGVRLGGKEVFQIIAARKAKAAAKTKTGKSPGKSAKAKTKMTPKPAAAQ